MLKKIFGHFLKVSRFRQKIFFAIFHFLSWKIRENFKQKSLSTQIIDTRPENIQSTELCINQKKSNRKRFYFCPFIWGNYWNLNKISNIQESKCPDLILHPHVTSLYNNKWKRIGFYFYYGNLCKYYLHCILYYTHYHT